MNGFDIDLATSNFERRKAVHQGKQINNAELPAGSPMHYYCRFCGAPTETLPECHLGKPCTCCDPCKVLHEHGAI